MEINFTEHYGKLYESVENGELKIFNFENEYGKIKNMFIKRKIPFQLENKDYFDIVTPYGYGGPVIQEATDEEKLLSGYFEAFSKYCQKNDIITEFIRFDLFENTQVRESFYGDTSLVGNCIVKNLKLPIEEDVRKKIFKDARIAKEKGVKIIMEQTGEHIDDFLEMYYSTMDRNGADDYYYFKTAYIEPFNFRIATIKEQEELINHVKMIQRKLHENEKADVSVLENTINTIIYKLYNLSEEEIRIIESNLS